MFNHAQPTSSSAAASTHGAATPSLALLEARRLRDALKLLLRKERSAMADFLVALADFDRRRGWEPLGHASLFAFLHVEMGLSKGAAYVRFTAARLLLAFPDVIDPIRQGWLCLSAVGELARVATAENFSEVLPRFFGCSSREAREVAAAVLPREAPPVRDQVTRLAPPVERRAETAPAPDRPLGLAPCPAQVVAALTLAPATDSESVRAHEPILTHPERGLPPRDDVEPLTADLRRLHITVSPRFLQKLDGARDGLSHAVPGATSEQVLEAALDLLLEKQARARGQVKRPRTTLATPRPGGAQGAASARAREAPLSSERLPTEPTPADPPATGPVHRRAGPREAIPAAVRRAVWQRDGGRCNWPLDGGGCCGSTHRLELDHVIPWARGGESSAANLRLTCARHNQVAARWAFGVRCVERYADGRGR